jgi:hypothetical protein
MRIINPCIYSNMSLCVGWGAAVIRGAGDDGISEGGATFGENEQTQQK